MEKQRRSVKSTLTRIIDIREMGVMIPMIIFFIYFASKNPAFLSQVNIINILRTASFTLIAGVGMTLLLITGSFDLSAGTQVALAGVSTGIALQAGVSVPLAILIGLAFTTLAGALLGFCTLKLKIPVFIGGIGVQYVIKGCILVVREGAPVFPLPAEFNALADVEIFGLPLVVIVAVIVALIGGFILKFTVYGRKLYAVGGNAETARLSGIRCALISFSAFLICGLLNGVSGVLTAARLNSGQPNAGADFQTTVIASCVIGGVSLFGGAGSILATVLGSLFMTMLTNGMTITGISPYYQQLVLGIILIFSVGFDRFRNTRKA